MQQAISRGVSLYFDRQVLSVFVLGVAQGLPWVIIGSMLTLWLKESGISRTEIGYAALIYSAYAINFLWSPIVDFTSPPFFNKLGAKKAWIVLCQLTIAVICVSMSYFDPSANAKSVVLLGLLIAICSATQDIAIDGYRVDSFAPHESEKISAAAGAITAGWWTGYAGVGAIPLFFSDMGWTWPQLYLLLGVFTAILALFSALLPQALYGNATARHETLLHFKGVAKAISGPSKGLVAIGLLSPVIVTGWAILGEIPLNTPSTVGVVILLCIANGIFLAKVGRNNNVPNNKPSSPLDSSLAWIMCAVVAPLQEFFSRNGVKLALALLFFIFSFKLGEAFLGRMSIVFYKEVGFTNTQIATYSKLLTWWLTVVFALLGGVISSKLGLLKGLMISGLAMAGTNLLFALMATVGPNEKLYVLTIVLDGFAAAWSSVTFVAFISLLCNHAFSATQYALMASLSNLGKTTLSSASGQIVDYLNGNWVVFFVMTTVMVIPSLVILWQMRSYIHSLISTTKE